jgi:hypothetical protein
MADGRAEGTGVTDTRRLLYGVNSIAHELDVCARTVKRMVADGRFPEPDFVDGNLIRWSWALLSGWFREKTGKEAA